MKFTRTNQSETVIILTVELDAADLQTIKPRTISQLSKQLKVAGFRPGKIPLAVAEKHIDPNRLNSQVAEDAVNHFVTTLFKQESIQPLDRPRVDVTAYVPGQQLTFTAKVEILPDIKLGDYKKLPAKKSAVNITKKETEQIIERMRLGLAEKSEVERAAKSTDEVWIDFEGKDADGKPVAGASGKDYPLALGSDTFIPGFEVGLLGKKAGDSFDLPLTFPKDYHHKPLAGAKVTFNVTVKKIKEVILPEINDDFAAKCGPFKTVDELKADIERELTSQKEREALERFKDELIEQLVKGSHIPVPEVLVGDQISSLERDFTQNLLYRGITFEQYLKDQGFATPEEWRDKELRPKAVRRVEAGLALAELSKTEDISVSTAELEERLAEMLQRHGSDAKFRAQLDTPEARRDIANRAITEKTVERLVDLNTKSSDK